jgi:ribosomal protein L7/L12
MYQIIKRNGDPILTSSKELADFAIDEGLAVSLVADLDKVTVTVEGQAARQWSSDDWLNIMGLFAITGRKIEAIRMYRTLVGGSSSLAEAIQAVEDLGKVLIARHTGQDFLPERIIAVACGYLEKPVSKSGTIDKIKACRQPCLAGLFERMGYDLNGEARPVVGLGSAKDFVEKYWA